NEAVKEFIQSSYRFACVSCLLCTAFGIFRKGIAARLPDLFLQGISKFTLIFELRNRQESCRRTGIAGSQNKFAVRRTCCRPFEIVTRHFRFTVLIGAE